MSRFFFQSLRQAVGSNTQVVYYCCSDAEEKRNTAVSMLRSVLCQIVDSVRKSEQVERQQCLQRHFDQQEEQAKNKAQDHLNNKDALWKVLLVIASEPVIGPIYCVLDGLDELDAESVEWLMRQYKMLPAGKERPESFELKVVIVSQEVTELRELAGEGLCAEISLEDAENKEHIQSDLEKVVIDKLRAIECVPKIEGEAEKRK